MKTAVISALIAIAALLSATLMAVTNTALAPSPEPVTVTVTTISSR